MPSGPLATSRDLQGLVETRTSLAEVATDGRKLTLHHLSRSSNDSALPDVISALDAAVIGDRVRGGLDMVCFGPQIEAPHSPDERVSIRTVELFWRLLAGVVDELWAA